MDRLTYKLGNDYGLHDKATVKIGLFKDYDVFFAYKKAVDKLGAYEDTGLTPEQIPEMSQMFRDKCEEVNRLENKTCEGCKREKTSRFDYKALEYCRSCSRAYKDEYYASEQDAKQE